MLRTCPTCAKSFLAVQRIHHGRCRRACVRIAGLYEEWRLVSRSVRSPSKALRPCYQPMRHFRGQSDASPRAGQSSGFAAGFKGTEAVRHMVVRIQVVARVGACRPAAFLLLSASGGDSDRPWISPSWSSTITSTVRYHLRLSAQVL